MLLRQNRNSATGKVIGASVPDGDLACPSGREIQRGHRETQNNFKTTKNSNN